MKKGYINRTQEKQAVHHTVPHDPQTDTHSILKQQSDSLGSNSKGSLNTVHDFLWYGISLWPFQIICPSCAFSQLLVQLLTD